MQLFESFLPCLTHEIYFFIVSLLIFLLRKAISNLNKSLAEISELLEDVRLESIILTPYQFIIRIIVKNYAATGI